MSKFNFKDWTNKKVVMHCKTFEEANDFCETMHNIGKIWRFGEFYKNNTYWDVYSNETCYNFNVGEYGPLYRYSENDYIILHWSDYMKSSTFSKKDLRTGDVIVRRNGNVDIVITETNSTINARGFCLLSSLIEDLTSAIESEWDVVDIYRPTESCQCQFNELAYTKGNHIYHRKDAEVEITLDEIAKLMKVPVNNIKIVK